MTEDELKRAAARVKALRWFTAGFVAGMPAGLLDNFQVMEAFEEAWRDYLIERAEDHTP